MHDSDVVHALFSYILGTKSSLLSIAILEATFTVL